MYNIENKGDLVYIYSYRQNKIIYSGKESSLPYYLSSKWNYLYWDGIAYSGFFDDYNRGEYIAYDNFDRIYNLNNYKQQSLIIFKQRKKQVANKKHSYWVKNKKYKGIYRKTPVEGIRKWRGGPSHKQPRTKHIYMMYDNPEYQEFNRGSKKLVPSWWDDKFRHVDKCWKSQRKARHQWKEKKE